MSPDRDPLTGIPPSRHPFQIWVLFACALSGLLTLLGAGDPHSLMIAVPHYMILLWGWSMFVGGLLGITSGWWRDRVTGLLLERVALVAISGSSAIYGFVVWWTLGSRAPITVCYCLSVAVAAAWRWRHVSRELRVLSRWIERHF